MCVFPAPAHAWSIPSASTRRRPCWDCLISQPHRIPEDGSVAIDPELDSWVTAVNAVSRNGTAVCGDVIVYLLEPAQRSWREAGLAQPISVSTVRTKRMRSNSYGREHPVVIGNLVGEHPPPYVGLEDQVIGRMLGGINAQSRRFAGLADAVTLERILATGRCHWRSTQSPPLSLIEPRRGRFSWRFDSEGRQRIVCELDQDGEETIIVSLGEPWFIDTANATCGKVETGLGQNIAGKLVAAPAVPPAAATAVASACSRALTSFRCRNLCASASGLR